MRIIKLVGEIMKKSKSDGKSGCPSKTPEIDKAGLISGQYKQLSNCCEILSKIGGKDGYVSIYSGGWRVYTSDLTGAGINIEEVYAYIGKQAMKRKLEIELELSKLVS